MGERCRRKGVRQALTVARYAPWDVVIVPFPYADKLAEKRRPALVVSKPALEKDHGLIWLAMITSAENRGWTGDVPIADLARAGLPAPSLVRPAKIATVESDAHPHARGHAFRRRAARRGSSDGALCSRRLIAVQVPFR